MLSKPHTHTDHIIICIQDPSGWTTDSLVVVSNKGWEMEKWIDVIVKQRVTMNFQRQETTAYIKEQKYNL